MSLAECWRWFVFAGMKESRDQELRRLCWRVAERRFGVQSGKYTQRGAYEVWELFRVANDRPDREWLDGACFWIVSCLQVTGAGNQNSGDCDWVIVVSGYWGDWGESLTFDTLISITSQINYCVWCSILLDNTEMDILIIGINLPTPLCYKG